VPKRDWEFIRELVTALGQTNSLRILPRVIGEALAPRWGARRVRLSIFGREGEEVFDAKRARGRWQGRHISEAVKTRRVPRPPSHVVSKTGTRMLLPLNLDDGAGELALWCGTSLPVLNDATYLETLARIIEVGLEKQRLVRRVAGLSQRAHIENRELREDLEKLQGASVIVARSPQMQEVMDRVAMVARFDTSVLIQGASGTGKEVVSREIHRRSSRCKKPFVQVNCGAIPSQLVESELFGHEEGAFTGATRTHRGVFEQAHQGVLFLDEVGDLPLGAQVKLLRALQEGRIRRVGAESELDVNVRVVAATNRPLAKMVRDGEFRDDLYFRLSVFPIDIPPLCDRVEDIAPLVRHLLENLASKLATGMPAVPANVLEALTRYSWPGNARELANVLETAIILGRGRTLVLPSNFASDIPRAAATAPFAPPMPLDATIRRAIEDALSHSHGKIYGDNGAAAFLGLHPATLQSKMRKLGIERNAFVAVAGRS
tara:strand:+ start:42980 stop:44446 length:1467 start_codon:yes stop_codon:yes gene_type:complete